MLSLLLTVALSLPDWGIKDMHQITRGQLAVVGKELQVLSLRMAPPHPREIPDPPEPPAGPIRPNLVKALWVWEPDDKVVEFVKREGVNRVLLQLPPAPEGLLRATYGKIRFADLVRQFHEAGIAVYGLDGDPHYAEVAHHPEVLSKVEQVIRFNQESPVPLEGVHLDIEPYLLPGFAGIRRDVILDDYLKLITEVNVRCRKADLKIGLDIPPWYDAPDEMTGEVPRPVAHRIIDLANTVALMDYRTDPHRALAEARPHVDYATETGKEILIGQETLPLPDEQLVFFAGPSRDHPSGKGSWVGSDGSRMFIHDAGAEPVPEAIAWWPVTHVLPLTGDSQSFAHLGARRLDDSLRYMAERLSAQKGFAGFAIHHYGSLATLRQENR